VFHWSNALVEAYAALMKRSFPENYNPAFVRAWARQLVEEERSASRIAAYEAIARGRAKAEKREEAKQAELKNVNRPPPDLNRSPDVFQQAAEDWYAREAYERAVLAQLEADPAQNDRELQARLKHLRMKRKALQVIARIDAQKKTWGK
jgi:hypothetical protein